MDQNQTAPPADKDRRLSVRVSDDLHARALAKSKRTGVSLAHVVRTALRRWVDGTWDPTREVKPAN